MQDVLIDVPDNSSPPGAWYTHGILPNNDITDDLHVCDLSMQSNYDDYCTTIHGQYNYWLPFLLRSNQKSKPGRRDLAQAAWHLQLMLQGNRVGMSCTRDLGNSETVLEYPGSRLHVHEYLEQFQFV